ncbi:MAG: hypothetical protein HC846_06480 [Blastocatellia bacterium]|nr:hypothetical protein [Blastocatellia bacterium]
MRMSNNNPDLIPAVLNTLAVTHIQTESDRSDRGGKNVYDDLTRSIEELKSSIAQKEAERLAAMRAENLPLTGDKGADFNSQRLSTLSGAISGG